MDEVEAAVAALDRGELIVIPTDTLYGLAARPDVPGATDKVFRAKRRSRGLTLPVLVASPTDADQVAILDARARTLADRFWPGGLTMVLPRAEAARGWDLGEVVGTVGVRVPNLDRTRALLARTGPLAVTSANISGEPTPSDCEGVRVALGDAVSVYLCEDPRPRGAPSTVVDLSEDQVRIARDGVVPAAEVLAALP